MIRIHWSMWRVLPATLALLVLASPVSLQAIIAVPDSTFLFSGVCTDCTGSATATLVLQNYTQGNDIFDYNLVSFHYDGTDLIPGGFTITGGDPGLVIGGVIPASLAAFADFNIHNNTWEFDSHSNGTWLAGHPYDDYGTSGLWNGADVPEPGAFLLVAAGLAMLGVRRWKVRN